MSIVISEIEETQHLADVLTVIARRIKRLKRERTKGTEELITYRKYMWEDAAFFDRAERVHRSSILRALQRTGYVFKKNGRAPRNRTDPTSRPNATRSSAGPPA